MDLLAPEVGQQEAMLTDYTSLSSGSVDDLSDNDFAQIPPIGNQ